MTISYEAILKLLRDGKSKSLVENGFSSSDFSEAIGRSVTVSRRLVRDLVRSGKAVFVGNEERPNICGGFTRVPIYRLTEEKKSKPK